MAQTINAARAAQGASARRAIGRYHWALLFLVAGLTLLISAPTLFSQPTIYETSATLRFDTARYNPYAASAAVQAEVQSLALEASKRELLKNGLTGFGSNLFGVSIAGPAADGSVTITSHGPSPEGAQQAANITADRLMRSLRATGGRDLLRRVMDSELYRMQYGQPPASAFSNQARQLIAAGVFDFPLRASATAPALADEDYNDIARALEVRYDQITWQLSDPKSRLTPLQTRDLELARALITRFLGEDHPQFQSSGVEPSAAYTASPAALPLAPRSQRFALKLLLVLLVGVVGGVVLVVADRAIGIVAKVRELWQYRELIRNLVARDLKARYKSSALGYVWSLLNPLMMLTLFYFVFGLLLGSPITNFVIFLAVALLPWNFFVGSMSEGMVSIIGNSNLVKKVYFPREILPIATLLSNLVNFMLALPVLFAIIIVSGAPIRATVLMLPVIMVIEAAFILGLILLLSALSVFYRDTTHIMGVILQLWFFVTPVFYPLENIVSPFFAKLVRWANPMASLVDFYRDILYGGLVSKPNLPTPGIPSLDGVARTALTAIIMLGIGAYVFHRLSGRFGEEL